MNRDDKYLARIIFQNKIYSSDAQAFENLFVKVMGYRYMGFRAVKPQGPLGDMKNDGYIIDQGEFYQVYGPEEISKSIDTAIKKLNEDFDGAIKKWDTDIVIKRFNYVVNDKYKGANVTVHKKLVELKTLLDSLGNCENIKVELITAKDIENTLFQLNEDDIIAVVGMLPKSEAIYNLNYDALNEVVEHIMNLPSKGYDDELYAPDIDEKIKFNGIGKRIQTRLDSAGLNYGDVEIYFNNNSDFLREDVKNRFKKLYEESKESIKETEENYADRRYMYILEKSMPENSNRAIQQAVECLMAYYFESCDIFEKPTA